MANKGKLINLAQKAMSKGQWDKAVTFLEKVLAEEPDDVRTMLKLGDVYAKKGDRGQACDVYRRVAEHHAQQGFFLKAVAVYKQILKLDPKNGDAALRIAELHEQLGLSQDAMVHFQLALPILEEKGDHERALGVLERWIELDPENVAARIKLAEALSRLDRTELAVEHFAEAARVLKQQARIEDYIKVAERLVFFDSDRRGLIVAKDLAKLYLSRGDTTRGLGKLQICFRQAPRDAETLTLLAKAFADLGQVPKSVYVYRELARVHQDEGRPNEAREIHRIILQHQPDDAEALRALGMVEVGTPVSPAPAAPLELNLESPVDVPHTGNPNMTGALPINASRDLREPTLVPPVETPFYGETQAPRISDPSDLPILPPAPAQEVGTGDLVLQPEEESLPAPPDATAPVNERVEQILSEAEVYISYNLPGKAIEHLEMAYALDSRSVLVYRRMHDAYLNMGDRTRAAEALANVVVLLEDEKDTSGAEDARATLEILAPNHPTLEGTRPRPATEFAGEPEQVSVDLEDTRSEDIPEIQPEDIEINTGEFSAPRSGARRNVSAITHDPTAPEFLTPILDPEAPPRASDGPPPPPSEAPVDDWNTVSSVTVLDPAAAAAALGAPAGARDLGDLEEYEPVSEAAVEVEADQLEASEIAPEYLEALPEDHVAAPPQAPPPPPRVGAPSWEPVSGFHEVDAVPAAEPVVASVPVSEDFDLAEAVAALERSALEPRPPSTDTPHEALDEASVEALLTPIVHRPAEPEAASKPADPEDLEDELAEVGFFLDADLFDEARETLEDLAQRYPGHPRVADHLSLLETAQQDGTPREAESAPIELLDVVESGELDAPSRRPEPLDRQAPVEANGHAPPAVGLSTISEQAEALPSPDLLPFELEAERPELPAGDEVLSFLDGAAPAPAPPEPSLDLGDQYDQGMAYKQIGQLEEAIAAFQDAAESNPDHAAMPLEMLGQCLVESGRLEEATRAFEAALDSASLEAKANLRYELGATYERLGDFGAARSWFEGCRDIAPHHRDVETRLLSLSPPHRDAVDPPEPLNGETPSALPQKRSKISYL